MARVTNYCSYIMNITCYFSTALYNFFLGPFLTIMRSPENCSFFALLTGVAKTIRETESPYCLESGIKFVKISAGA